MPRDDWARAKIKDRMRRISFDRTASRPRKHRKKAAPGPARIPIRLKVGQVVQIRRNDNDQWQGHEMRKSLTLNVPYPITTEWVEMQYFDWWLRIPRPRGFRQ